MKHTLLACLVFSTLAAGTGCCELRPMFSLLERPLAVCDPGPCCDPVAPRCGLFCRGTCGGICGPSCESDCAPPCDPCGDSCGDPCGPCDDACYPCGPLSWLFAIFTRGSYPDSGCGEVYWSDFHNEPPDCCDPCDRLGNWTGGSCAQGYCQSGTYENAVPEGYAAASPSSRYAPRIVSVTDRAVNPVSPEPTATRHVARPRQASFQR